MRFHWSPGDSQHTIRLSIHILNSAERLITAVPGVWHQSLDTVLENHHMKMRSEATACNMKGQWMYLLSRNALFYNLSQVKVTFPPGTIVIVLYCHIVFEIWWFGSLFLSNCISFQRSWQPQPFHFCFFFYLHAARVRGWNLESE